MPQLKFAINDELLKKFKQIVLAKHGKINLTPEGENAIKLYIEKNEKLIRNRSQQHEDPLTNAVGLVRSRGTHNALDELKEFEMEEEQ